MTASLTSLSFPSDPATLADLPLDRWPRGGVALVLRPEDQDKPHAVIYARISRDGEGKHLGVRRQIQKAWAMLAREGFAVVHLYQDNDITAYEAKKPRPDYEAMMRRAGSDSVAVIGAWHTDRLHRDMRDLCDYIDVVRPTGVMTHCVKAGKIDLRTSHGVMVAQIGAAVATQEVAHLQERILAKKAQQRADGEWLGGRAPFGYTKAGKHSLAIVDSEAETIRAAAQSIIGGATLGSVAAKWNAEHHTTRYGNPWSAKAVRPVMVSATTAGRNDRHTDRPALWDAILDSDTWEGVRSVLSSGKPVRKLRPRSPRRLLSGVAVCGKCGAPMKAGVKDTGAAIYRCSASEHVKRLAEPVDDVVAARVIERLSAPDAVSLLTPDRSADVTELHARLTGLRARKESLGEAFAAGEIDRDGLRAGTERLRTDIAETEDRLTALSAGSVLDGLAGRPDVAERWVELPIDQRRAVVEAVATVTILPGRRGGNAATRDVVRDVTETVRIEWP